MRVLIVEDELVIAMELESLLRELGCRVMGPLPTVKRALRALTGESPDAALLDVNLQGERVTPVAAALRERGIPFVLITGYGSIRLNEAPLQDAVHLLKPVEISQLLRALQSVLAAQDRAKL